MGHLRYLSRYTPNLKVLRLFMNRCVSFDLDSDEEREFMAEEDADILLPRVWTRADAKRWDDLLVWSLQNQELAAKELRLTHIYIRCNHEDNVWQSEPRCAHCCDLPGRINAFMPSVRVITFERGVVDCEEANFGACGGMQTQTQPCSCRRP